MIESQGTEPVAEVPPAADPITAVCVVRPTELVAVASATGTPVASRQVCLLHREPLRVRTEALGGAAQVSAESLADEVPLVRCEVDQAETGGRLWLDVRCTARATGKVELYSRQGGARAVDPRSFVATIYTCAGHSRPVSEAGVAAGWHGAGTLLPVSPNSYRTCGDVVDLQRPLRWPSPVSSAAEPEPEHRMVRGWKGEPGECGAECACGVTYDGFDSLGRASELLDGHIANPGPAPVLASALHGGLWIATGDPDEPGLEVRYVLDSDDRAVVGVMLAGPSYREYAADEMVRLVDREVVDAAREKADRRRRREAMIGGLRALADLAEARPDLVLPDVSLRVEGYLRSAGQVAEVAELIGAAVERRYGSASTTWFYGAPEATTAPVTYRVSAADDTAPADDPIPAVPPTRGPETGPAGGGDQ